MRLMNKTTKWSGVLLTAALILSGCSVTTLPEEPTAESTAIEGTALESTAVDITITESTEEGSDAAKENSGSSGGTIPVTESENGLFLMEEGQSYLLDMDGDGTAETIRYQSTEGEDYRYPQLYINDQLLFDNSDTYGYSIEIYLTDIDQEDSHREICIYTTVESGTTQSVIFMRNENNTLKLFENLSGRTIFGGAGQYFRGGLMEVRGDGTVVIETDTPVYTSMFGCYYVPITFQTDGYNFREISQDSYSLSGASPEYVANSNFTALTEPNGNEAAFSTVPGDLIKFDGFCILDGQFYGRVTNSAGVSGWLVDLENLYPGEDGAYFEEVMAWG